MLVFPCQVCRTQLSADEAQAGQAVRCPTCLSVLNVPTPQMVAAGSAPPPPLPSRVTTSSRNDPNLWRGTRPTPGKRFGFNCVYCSSRLEANEGMSGQERQCPTCGSVVVIPILDKYGRLIDHRSGEILKPDPHPVHAYAAAGERAPKIIRATTGQQQIQCPRCAAMSPITANNCRNCGMPFTMEGTTREVSGTSNGFCVASLVLGLIGIPTCFAIIPSLLAIIFGVVGWTQISQSDDRGGKGMAIAGIVLGIIGCLAAMRMHFF